MATYNIGEINEMRVKREASFGVYLDAGTGSMILQLLLGGVAGIAIARKLYWHRLMTFLGIRSESVELAGQEEALPESKISADK